MDDDGEEEVLEGRHGRPAARQVVLRRRSAPPPPSTAAAATTASATYHVSELICI